MAIPTLVPQMGGLEHVNFENADSTVLALQYRGVSTLRKISHADGREGPIPRTTAV
jgi:hypothetical protein